MGGICGTHGLSHALHSMASATGRRRAAVWRGMAAVAVTFGRLGECYGCALRWRDGLAIRSFSTSIELLVKTDEGHIRV